MRSFLLILLFILQLSPLQADRGLQLKQMQKEQRIALIIGNNSYNNLANLKNPVNDARAMRDTLEDRGFSIIYKENATKREMKKLVKKFAHQLSYGGIGMYYFAGHGVNVGGTNYLVGVDSLMEEEEEVEFETLSLNYITSKMKNAKNRLNIIVLDACRNNPFGRSGGGGLAPISNAKGIFVAYATEAGSIASDGKSGKNGLFTKHLIYCMQEPGVDLAKVFKNTRRSVYNESDGKQSPGVYDQTLGDFFFTLPTKLTNYEKDIKKKSSFNFTTNKPKIYSLTINTVPSNATVHIKNTYSDYYSGINLKRGSYEIEVSKNGYESKTGTIDLQSDLDIEVVLNKKQTRKLYSSKNLKSNINEKSCFACHGINWDKKALGKSKIVSSMTHQQISNALLGYKAGTYGGPMKGLMKGQVAKYSDSALEAFAQTIGR